MKSMKKLILAFSISAISSYAVLTVDSCSKLQALPDVKVKLNWDENEVLSVAKSVSINVDNYKLLNNEGYSKNRSVVISGDSVTEAKNTPAANDSITLSGVKEGTSTVNVSFVNLLTQQIASGSFKIHVVDYSKIKIKYNDKEGTDSKPFNLDNTGNIFLGQFEEKDWKSLPQSIKSSFQVQAQSSEDADNVAISDIVNFSINDNGQIIGKRKVSSAHWPKVAHFEIKVVYYQGNTNFNDDGHKFSLDKMKDTISLNIADLNPLTLPYDGDKNNFNKLKTIDKPIEFLVGNKDFDWSLVDDQNLDDIAKNITVNSTNASDPISDFSLIKNETKNAFELSFKYKEISLSSSTINIDFDFKAKDEKGKNFAQSVSLNINNYRHGVKELDYDNEKRKLNLVPTKDVSKGYDFVADGNIQSSNLINPFTFKVTDSSNDFDNLKNNGYNYKKSVVLSAESFKSFINDPNIAPISGGEDSDIVQKFNNKIEKTDVTDVDKNYQKEIGLGLTADLINNNIEAKSNGINIGDDGTYKGGEYFILNKFIDDKNNYQFNYADFKWQGGKIDLPSKPIQIESHLLSMPISHNSDSNLQNQKLGSYSSNEGNDTGAGTEDNPLMLSFKKYDISKPGSGNFEDNWGNTYRGYLKLNNIDGTKSIDLNSIKVSLVNADSIATLKENPIIQDGENYYINMTMLGQNEKDVKNSKFTIKIQVNGQSEYDYDVYYAAYAGDTSEKGNYIADDNISSSTSLYVAETALNRSFYLGLSRKNKASIKDVYFEDGYTYSGNQGALTTGVAPNKSVPDSLKNIENVTFSGKLDVAGSYVFMGSFGSGIEGYLSFLKDVNFTSNNSYSSASNKSYDKNFSSSAVLLGGNLSGKPESTLIGKKGINFEGDINLNVKPAFWPPRYDESLSVVATTREMDCGSININGTTNFEINSTGIRDAAFIINENIDSDASVSPNQHFGNIKLNNGIKFTSDSTPSISNENEIRSLVIDKKGLNLKLLNGNNDELCTIDVNRSDQGAFISTTTSIVSSDLPLNPVILASDTEGIGWNNNNKSVLPNININNYSTARFPSYVDPKKQTDKSLLNVKPILAWGKYALNQTGRIKYIDESKQPQTFEYKNLNENYNKFTIL